MGTPWNTTFCGHQTLWNIFINPTALNPNFNHEILRSPNFSCPAIQGMQPSQAARLWPPCRTCRRPSCREVSWTPRPTQPCSTSHGFVRIGIIWGLEPFRVYRQFLSRKKSYSKYEKAVDLEIFGEKKHNFQVPYLIIIYCCISPQKIPIPKAILDEITEVWWEWGRLHPQKKCTADIPAVTWPWGIPRMGYQRNWWTLSNFWLNISTTSVPKQQ